MRHLILACLLVWCVCVAAEEVTAPPFTPSPVIEWGRPLTGGPIRALFLLQSAKQEALELMRRVDIQGEALASSRSGKYGFATTEASIARRKLAGEPVDVVVVGGIYWKSIPATLRLAILEKVRQGMGLLYVDAPKMGMDTTLPKLMAADPAPEAVAAVTTGIPLPLLPLVTIDPERNGYTIYPDAGHPAPTPEQLVTGARFGKGRICLLHYSVGQSNVVYLYSLTPALRRQDMPFVREYPYWEYCHSLLGKAVRWCAGRDPDVSLAVEATGSANPAGPLATVTLAGARTAGPVEVEAVVRDHTHAVCAVVKSQLAVVPATPTIVAVTVPAAKRPPGGLYFVDVWARRDGKVVDWATGTGELPASARLSVRLDRERYTAEQPVRATVEVTGAAAEARVALTLTGTDGRLLARQELPARPEVIASFSLAGAQTLVSYLDARLLEGASVVWRERVPVFLAPGPPREFFAYSWMQGETYYARDYLRRIRDQAVDAVLAAGGAATYFAQGGRMAAEMNLRLVPTNVVDTRNAVEPGTQNLKRPLTDPRVLAAEDKSLRAYLPHVVPLQPLGYSLMDEWVLGSSQAPTDYSASALTAFRQWLPGKYRDVAALNAEWGTSFATWEDVRPQQVEEIRKGIPAGPTDWSKLNLAPFVDYRLFMDTVGPAAFSHFAATIRELDPGAKVGLCGTESNSTWFGHDWYALARALDFICGYGDASPLPNIASFRGLQRELQRSFRQPGSLLSCWVGYSESAFYRDQALKLLLHDSQGIAYFSGEPVAYQDFPYLDYDFTLSHRALISGAGVRELRQGLDQLIWSSRRDNSGIAILMSQPSLHAASALGQEGRWGDACVTLTRVVEDAGFQYDFISAEQLAARLPQQRGYRALLLPGATSLSDDELAAIRDFATGGRTVLYDRSPGVLDEHGKSRPQAPTFTGSQVVALTGIGADRGANVALLKPLLAAAGLQPPVTVTHDAKAFLPTETVVYHNGEQTLVSLQTDMLEWRQPTPTATIALPREAFVYDVREGKFLGRTQQVTATLDPMHILLYALLPSEVRAVTVAPAVPAVKPGGSVPVRLAVETAGAPSGTHFLRVTLAGPDGQERPGFARTVKAGKGTAETELLFALSDPPGRWTITARDAATGVRGTATVEVQP